MQSPIGHTLYSWYGRPEQQARAPIGHTAASWWGPRRVTQVQKDNVDLEAKVQCDVERALLEGSDVSEVWRRTFGDNDLKTMKAVALKHLFLLKQSLKHVDKDTCNMVFRGICSL